MAGSAIGAVLPHAPWRVAVELNVDIVHVPIHRQRMAEGIAQDQLQKLETARDQAAKDVLTLNVSGAMWGCTQTDVSWSDKNELSFSTNENLGLLSTDQSQVRILNFDISFISDLGLSHETIALIVTTEYYSDYKKYWIYKYLL